MICAMGVCLLNHSIDGYEHTMPRRGQFLVDKHCKCDVSDILDLSDSGTLF